MKATYTTMIASNGKEITWGVYQVEIKTRKNSHKRYINMNAKTTTRIAVVKTSTDNTGDPRLEIAKKYQTAEYPAFAW